MRWPAVSPTQAVIYTTLPNQVWTNFSGSWEVLGRPPAALVGVWRCVPRV
jgi:hypothetical protein